MQCFADDMTAIMEETKENLIKMKEMFECFRDLSGLEIDAGKTKVIWTGANLDYQTPKTNEVKFKYETSFQLLGVNIHIELRKELVKKLQSGEN
jgi:hypothetical protein